MKRVIVTGAGGFIGKRCLPLLEARGFTVQPVASRTCDLLDPRAIDDLVAGAGATHLLHLAWIAEPGVFWSSPQNLDWLEAGAHLVRRFYDNGGARAVGVGSCAEYAVSAAPCSEADTPLEPETVYGEAKVSMSFALRAAARGRGSWAWARLFFPYGPGEAAGRFIPSVIAGLRRGEPVACTHGRQVRDFIYVDDVAAACVALLEAAPSGAYNVGSGEGRSLREVAAEIARHTGRGELVRFDARPPPAYDPPSVVADIRRMRALGWTPRIGLAEGIRLTVGAA